MPVSSRTVVVLAQPVVAVEATTSPTPTDTDTPSSGRTLPNDRWTSATSTAACLDAAGGLAALFSPLPVRAHGNPRPAT